MKISYPVILVGQPELGWTPRHKERLAATAAQCELYQRQAIIPTGTCLDAARRIVDAAGHGEAVHVFDSGLHLCGINAAALQASPLPDRDGIPSFAVGTLIVETTDLDYIGFDKPDDVLDVLFWCRQQLRAVERLAVPLCIVRTPFATDPHLVRLYTLDGERRWRMNPDQRTLSQQSEPSASCSTPTADSAGDSSRSTSREKGGQQTGGASQP